MINPKFEIDRLRQTLIWKGLDDREATDISNLAAQDISAAISDIVLDAMAEAIEVGQQLGVEEFADQIRAVNTGNTVMLVTDSGTTNFSYPALPMLPHLLKNAKTAKDGSQYKVIPIRPKRKMATSSADVATDIAQAQQIARDNLKNNKSDSTSGDPLQSTAMFSGLAQAKEFIARKQQIRKEQGGQDVGKPEFRTASSKQDPTTKWVLPAKDRDMTMLLTDVNRRLEMDIQNTVMAIVKEYEGLV